MASGAPDLEMNGAKVQVQHMNLFFSLSPCFVCTYPQIMTQALGGAGSYILRGL